MFILLPLLRYGADPEVQYSKSDPNRAANCPCSHFPSPSHYAPVISRQSTDWPSLGRAWTTIWCDSACQALPGADRNLPKERKQKGITENISDRKRCMIDSYLTRCLLSFIRSGDSAPAPSCWRVSTFLQPRSCACLYISAVMPNLSPNFGNFEECFSR